MNATEPLTGGRHPVNITHLVLGVVLVGLTLVWALIASDAVSSNDIRWLLPIPWVAAGAAGLAATVVRPRRTSSHAPVPHHTAHTEHTEEHP